MGAHGRPSHNLLNLKIMNVSLNLSIASVDQLEAILETLEQRGLLAVSPVTSKPIAPNVSILRKSPIELEYNKAFGTFRLTKQEADILASGACTRDQLIQARLDCTTPTQDQDQDQDQFTPVIDVPSKGLF